MAELREMQKRGYQIQKIEKRHEWYGAHIVKGTNHFIIELDSLEEFSDEELEEFYAN